MNKKIKSFLAYIPKKKEIRIALGTFSLLERLLFILLIALTAISMLITLRILNERFLVEVPTQGGTLVEGIVGTPRFVNPVLATTPADRDATILAYRGLTKRDPNGTIVPDIATSFEISEDGKTYTFTLGNAVFHDNTPITPEDVAFTINAVRDPLLKSIHRVEWEGVGVATDQNTVTFTLANPYSPFIESTTLGILPKHVWEGVTFDNWIFSDLNTEKVIGSGNYKVTKTTKNSSGIPEEYTLERFTDEPLIDTIKLRFYANESDLIDAFKKREVASISGVSPENISEFDPDTIRILSSPLPRVFGLFYNSTQAKLFTDKTVRRAIDSAIDKHAIIQNIFNGYAESTQSPVLQNESLENQEKEGVDVAAVKELLEDDDWELGEDGIYTQDGIRLSFEIATNNVPELKTTAEYIVQNLRTVGIEAILKVYETGSLSQDIIRPRKFETLFFGESVTNQSDLFAFWHSSQKTDPGLNITGYTNARVDKILEKLLATTDTDEQTLLYTELEEELAADIPASFIYVPSFIYITRDDMDGITLGTVTRPEHRFQSLPLWHLETDSVWKLFTN